MPFDFNLQAVLRARLAVEEREERLLQKILIEVANCSREMTRLDTDMERVNAARQNAVMQPSLGRTLQGQYGEVQELNRVRDLLAGQIAKLNELKDAQLTIYHRARQDRELLSEMRTTQRIEYIADRSRREQGALDDNFIARRSLA